MWKPKSREERELGPELGEGEVKTIEDIVREEEHKKNVGHIFAEILILIAVLASGFLVAFLVAKLNDVNFGFYTWPLIACTDVFVFTTIGFFSTEGRTEKIYGLCSIASIACVIVQIAVLF